MRLHGCRFSDISRRCLLPHSKLVVPLAQTFCSPAPLPQRSLNLRYRSCIADLSFGTELHNSAF